MLNENRQMRLSRDPITGRVPFVARYSSLDQEYLSSALFDYVEAKRRHLLVWDSHEPVLPGDRRYRLVVSQLERECDRAAAFALDVWDPTFKEKLSAAGRKGGQKSKRGAVITVEMLRAVEGLSIPEQMEALHCSASTIARRRRELKNQACN
ncbi:hypothetical protein [Curtobacterium sp. MCBD17_040]|uniref:hypothetical protein n=1 Tax=Curtobacterium sp. MCBD17_040 TaxID=2175674 RepID=UPI0011B6FC8E|nr:hypothetical protein [Curtobacterium sp. MCBD17_040]WIB64380.1 hypothetical protein DEI94_04065 [Curtobacterium sp. MCBD17_040]